MYLHYQVRVTSGTLKISMYSYWAQVVQWVLHLDQTLGWVIRNNGSWTYAILFGVIVLETGLVIAPFLPGDSLLFAAGTFAGFGALSIWILVPLLIIGAIIGDGINYWIGSNYGLRFYRRFEGRILKPEYLVRTQKFYARHGAKMIVLARFMPVIRTVAPFVAGVGQMPYRTFFRYNVVGAVAWVVLLTLAGYYFGTVSIVRRNFTIVIMAIVVISLLPMVIEGIRAHRAAKLEKEQGEAKD